VAVPLLPCMMPSSQLSPVRSERPCVESNIDKIAADASTDQKHVVAKLLLSRAKDYVMDIKTRTYLALPRFTLSNWLEEDMSDDDGLGEEAEKSVKSTPTTAKPKTPNQAAEERAKSMQAGQLLPILESPKRPMPNSPVRILQRLKKERGYEQLFTKK